MMSVVAVVVRAVVGDGVAAVGVDLVGAVGVDVVGAVTAVLGVDADATVDRVVAGVALQVVVAGVAVKDVVAGAAVHRVGAGAAVEGLHAAVGAVISGTRWRTDAQGSTSGSHAVAADCIAVGARIPSGRLCKRLSAVEPRFLLAEGAFSFALDAVRYSLEDRGKALPLLGDRQWRSAVGVVLPEEDR